MPLTPEEKKRREEEGYESKFDLTPDSESKFPGGTTQGGPKQEGYDLGKATKKKLGDMYGGEGITKRDLRAARRSGMSQEEMQRQYDEHVAAGGKVHAGAQAKMNDFNQVKSLADFDADDVAGINLKARAEDDERGPRKDLRRVELASLLGTAKTHANHGVDGKGFKASEVNEMIKERGYTLGSGAQQLLNKHLEKQGSDVRTDITDPKDGTPVMDTKPPFEVPDRLTHMPVKDVAQIINDDSKIRGGKGDDNINRGGSQIIADQRLSQKIDNRVDKMNDNKLETTIGDDNVFYGPYNSGMQDFSVNINGGQLNADQRVGGGSKMADGSVSEGVRKQSGAMGLGGGGADNFASTAASMALFENILKRNDAQFSGAGRAQAAIDAAERQIGSAQRVANLDYLTRNNPQYNEAKATAIGGKYLGDLDSYATPDLVKTADPEKYDVDFDKIRDEYKLK